MSSTFDGMKFDPNLIETVTEDGRIELRFPIKYHSVDVEFKPSMFKYHPIWGAAWGFMTPEQMAEWEKWVLKQQAMGNLQGVSDPPEVKPHPLEPQPTKKCTCGAHSCGHNGHSSWCDINVTT